MNRKNMLTALALCLLTTVALAKGSGSVALVLKTAGSVAITKQGRSTWSSARRGERIHSGEVLKTGQRSVAALVFTDDKSLMKIRSNSSVTIKGKRVKNSIAKRIQIAFGEIWAKVTKQNVSMRIESPSGVATVKGTELNCLFANDNFFVFCQRGLVELSSPTGVAMLRANEMGRIERGKAPEKIQGDPSKIFDLSNEDSGKSMEIEFEDADGNKKTLIIDFK